MCEVKLAISGMHCAACKSAVIAAAERAGASADVDVLSGVGIFRIDDNSNLAPLLAAIKQAGFGAELISSKRQKPIWQEFIPCACSLICSIFCLFLPFWPAAFCSAIGVACGAGKFIRKALFHRAYGMDLLISLGIFINFSFSFLFEHSYFFECSFIAFIVAFGKACESAAKRYAAGLLRPRAAPCVRLVDGSIISASELKAGCIMQLAAGETLQTDAIALSDCVMDLAVSSGESQPVRFSAGAKISAGAVALGVCQLRASSDYASSSLALLCAQAERASAASVADYGWIDTAARWFSAVIISIAMVVFAIWWQLADAATAAFYASSVLLISCPCALGLAVPMSVACAVALCFSRGVVIKNSAILHSAPALLVADKTGTLSAVKTQPVGISEPDFALLLSVQNLCFHPLAAALLEHKTPTTQLLALSGSAELDGFNLRFSGLANGQPRELLCQGDERGFALFIDGQAAGRVDVSSQLAPGARELARSQRLVISSGDCASACAQTAAELGGAGFAARCSSKDKALLIRSLRHGCDKITSLAAECLATKRPCEQDLQAAATDTSTLVAKSAKTPTSSHFAVDFSTPEGAQFREQLAQLPRVNKLAKKDKIFYLGDGANDLATVRAADFVIAIAHGHAALSANAAAVVPSAAGCANLLRISAACRRKIRANLALSFAYNVVGIALASGLIMPSAHLSPALCATLMSASSLVVVGNSLLLLRQR